MDYIQIFKDFLKFDKEFVDELLDRYDDGMEFLGKAIHEHYTKNMLVRDNDFMREFIEFIDGNNFILKPSDKPNFLIILIDWEGVENEKKKSLNGMVHAVSETILSYTSMEDCERYILEYKKFLASWTFWLRVCRRVELLRLVPKGRCRSPAVPRPP